MTWQELCIAPTNTCHLCKGSPAYQERFDEVLAFHAPGLAPVRRAGKAWHIHPNGQAAYTRRFKRTFGFYDGLATVISADGWHHIVPAGTDLYPQRYAWCGNFQDKRCTVRNGDGKYWHIQINGKPAYSWTLDKINSANHISHIEQFVRRSGIMRPCDTKTS